MRGFPFAERALYFNDMGEPAKINQIPFSKESETFEQWQSDLVNLGTIERHVQFFIGDKILEGETKKYIERGKYDLVSELTGIEKSLLMEYVSVTKSISLLRNKDLPYSHHREVAKLAPDDQEKFLNQAAEKHWSVSTLRDSIKKWEIDQVEKERDKEREAKAPIIYHEDCTQFLKRFEDKSIDLLLTDPPYSTDISDLPTFLDTWLYDSLNKIKDTGRAFICIGAYPIEIYTYLGYLLFASKMDWILDCPLIWTYRNTLGQTPDMKYNLNYQLILHLYKKTSNPLDNRITNEMFSVQDINAPDGRIGNRFYKWQKPDMLAERLILHSTEPGDKIIDPFVGSGTFILKASENNRLAWGCENDPEILDIAINRGCKLI